ncbi:hypothetical protein PQR67_20705 [Paraburkholderia fungorum]|uniref:hypothetical protein n=1 Tax=Paraburkholderia fungorum TaxID=134537 RepID=UPI0038BC88A9
MREDISSQPAVDHAENWSRHLPGFQLTHVIHLVSIASMDVVSRVAAHLKDQQVSVSSFVVLRSGNILDQKIVLDDIGERQAKLLREKLLILDGVLRIRLEHLFVRPDSNRATENRRPSGRSTREFSCPC